jgi:hypothetical protein
VRTEAVFRGGRGPDLGQTKGRRKAPTRALTLEFTNLTENASAELLAKLRALDVPGRGRSWASGRGGETSTTATAASRLQDSAFAADREEVTEMGELVWLGGAAVLSVVGIAAWVILLYGHVLLMCGVVRALAVAARITYGFVGFWGRLPVHCVIWIVRVSRPAPTSHCELPRESWDSLAGPDLVTPPVIELKDGELVAVQSDLDAAYLGRR